MGKSNTTKEIRPGCRRVELYNEGLCVYLYDEDALAWLRETEAYHVLVTGDVENQAKRQREIEKRGLIVIYELQQDDSVAIDIALGQPLTAKEKKAAAWHKTQKTLINLPSGRLRIETPNSSRLGDEEPQQEGITLSVPPGSYLLTLHRINWEALDEGIEERQNLPSEFISLTPLAETKPPAKPKSVLAWDEISGNQGAWEGQWKLRDGVFYGLVLPGIYAYDSSSTFVANLTPTAAGKLGLHWGARLLIETDRWQTEAIYLAQTTLFYAELIFGKTYCTDWPNTVPFHSRPALAMTPGSSLLGFSAYDPAVDYPVVKTGEAVRISVLPNPVEPPPDRTLLTETVVDTKKREISGRVLAACESCLLLNIDWNLLTKVNTDFSKGDKLYLLINGMERECHVQNNSTLEPVVREFYSRIPAARSLLEQAEASDKEKFGDDVDSLLAQGMLTPAMLALAKLANQEGQRLRKQAYAENIPSDLQTIMPLTWRWMSHCEVRGKELLALFSLLNGLNMQSPPKPLFIEAQAGTAFVLRVVRKSA